MGGLFSNIPSIPYQEDMHVVVVGGGYGGALIAFLLKKKNFCKVTLIDPKDCMVHCVASLRSCVEKGFARNVFIPYEDFLDESFRRGRVVKLNAVKKKLTLEDKSKVAYTHLVIATGSSSPFPGKPTAVIPKLSKEEGLKLYEDIYKEMEKAQSVVCIGGGTVGVEMAGEVKTEFPEKEVTIITSGSTLGSKRMKPNCQSELLSSLENLGVKVVFEEEVTNIKTLDLNKFSKSQVVKTNTQQTLVTDFVMPCTGTTINTDFCKKSLSASMTDSGALQVDQFFQVKDHERVYAIGDVTNIDEEKMARTAQLHARVLAANLVAEITQEKKTPYQAGDQVMFVPIGRNGGVGEYKGITVPSFVVKHGKSTDLFNSKIWGELGLKPPIP